MFQNNFVKRILSMTLAVCLVLSLAALIEPKSYTVSAEAEPVLLANSAEAQYEQLTFSDFGVADGEILNQNKWTSTVQTGDLDEILFRGKYYFPEVETSKKPGNIYLGRADWWSIAITQDNAGNILLDVIGATFSDKTPCNLTATNPDVQLRGEEVEVAISVKYENTTSTATDLKIGVWIDGVLSKGGYIYAKNVPLTDLTRCLHFYDGDANSTVTVKSVKGEIKPEQRGTLLSESPENNYEKLTFSDFGVADGEILTEAKWTSETKDGGLDEILFQGKYTFPAADQVKQFGNIYLGKADWWTIVLNSDSQGNMIVDAIGGTIANKVPCNLTATNPDVQLRGEEVEIAISVKYENTTSTTTDLKIGVWIDGVLSKGGYIEATNVPLSNLTRCLHFYDAAAGSGVPVKSVKEEVTPEPGPEPDPEPTDILLSESSENDYEKLTFADFGIADGDILNQGLNQHFISTVVPEGDLDEILFQGKYTFPTLEQSPKFGNIYVGAGKYYGIAITTDGQGNILFDVISTSVGGSAMEAGNDRNMTLNSPVELRGQEVEIAFSVKYENTTADKTDLKIGVWINGVLMQGKYLYARGVTLADLTRSFHTLDTDNNSVVKVASVGKTLEPADVLLSESEEKGYEKLTFADFGLPDGDILTQGNGAHFVSNVLEGDLDEVLFQGKFLYPTMEASRLPGSIYLGRANWWAIGLTMDSSANIMLSVPSGTIENTALTNLTANNPDVQLRGKEVEIAISVKYENKTADKTDLKIGVWFDGVLQNGGYIIAKGVPLTDLTRCFHTYDTDSNAGLKVASVGKTYTPPDVLLFESEEKGYEKLTFADFEIENGEILTQGNGLHFVSTVMPEGDLNEILFQGKYTYPTMEASAKPGNIYLGRANWWAVGLTMDSAGNVLLSVPSGTIENTAITNLTANNPNVQLRGKEVEIAISIKYENTTADKTDLKIGVWFDGVLQNGGYIIAKNVPLSDLTRCFHTYDTDSNAGLKVASVGKVYKPLNGPMNEVTNADLGIQKGTYTATVLGADAEESLNGYAITTEVTFGKGASIAYGKEGKGIVFTYAGEGILKAAYVKADGTAVAIGEVKIPTKGAAKLRTTVELLKADTKTDLRLGVFVNGKLAGYEYFLVEDVDTSVLTKSMAVLPNGSEIRIGANAYETVTLRDFIIADKTRSDYGGRFSSYEGANYDGTAFSAVLGFSDETQQKNDNCFYVGGKEWAGVRVELDANGNLAFSFVHAGGVQIQLVKVTPEEVGMETFQGKTFDYRVTFDVLEAAEGKLDAVIGIYVNGVLCGGKHQFVKNVDAVVLERGLFSYVDKNGGSLTMGSTNKTVDFTIFGLNSNWKNTLGIK